MWHEHDVDRDVDEMPTPFGERDILDQVQEAALLLGSAVVLALVLVAPAVIVIGAL